MCSTRAVSLCLVTMSTMTNLKPIVLLDQDGPLADFDTAIALVLTDLGLDPSRLIRTTWHTSRDIEDCFSAEVAEDVIDAVHAPGFFRDLPVTPGAQSGVKTLLDAGCAVFVCTSPKLANPSCASDKFDWITRHIPSLRRNVVVTKDKTLVHGHLLIDDKPNITGVIEPSWQHVMFSTPGNAASVPVSGLRLPSWDDVEWLAEHAHLLASGSIRS